MSNPRLRVLELPSVHAGDVLSTPFVIVIDRCETLNHANEIDLSSTGAETTLLFDQEIDLE